MGIIRLPDRQLRHQLFALTLKVRARCRMRTPLKPFDVSSFDRQQQTLIEEHLRNSIRLSLRALKFAREAKRNLLEGEPRKEML